MIGSLRQMWTRQGLILASQRQSGVRLFSAFANHRNTQDNNEDTPFEFTKENYEEI